MTDAIRVLPAEPVGRFAQIAFQRDRPFKMQFPADVRPLVVERLPVVVPEDPVDARGFQSQEDQAAEPDFTAGQFGIRFLQPGEQSRMVDVGQYQEFIAHRTAFSPCRGQDAVETFGQQIDAVAAQGGGIHDIGEQIDQDADGRLEPVAVFGDKSEQFTDFRFPAVKPDAKKNDKACF